MSQIGAMLLIILITIYFVNRWKERQVCRNMRQLDQIEDLFKTTKKYSELCELERNIFEIVNEIPYFDQNLKLKQRPSGLWV